MVKDFVLAALPWVLAGIAVAILCAGMGTRKAKENSKALEEHMAVGTALGLMAGVALNYCGLWESHALGLTLGPLWGMALATLSVGRRNDDESEQPEGFDSCHSPPAFDRVRVLSLCRRSRSLHRRTPCRPCCSFCGGSRWCEYSGRTAPSGQGRRR